MSVENDYYALICSGPNVPEVIIFKTVYKPNSVKLIFRGNIKYDVADVSDLIYYNNTRVIIRAKI